MSRDVLFRVAEEGGLVQKSRKSGFTLVELMIVAIIVALLAAVAIPTMMRNRQRAMITEAESGLGTMRSALRAMFADTRAYNVSPDGTTIAAGAPANVIPGIQAGGLVGRYFDDAAYSILSIGADDYTLQADGDDSGATEAAEVAGITIT